MYEIVYSLFVGFLFRFALFLTNFGYVFQKRVEISTPLNSWVKVKEGIFLLENNISPYSGDTFHETPLTLIFAQQLLKFPEIVTFLIFTVADLLTAIILAAAVEESRKYYLTRSQKESKYVKELTDLAIKENDNYAEFVILSYMFNPFTIFNCVGQTTTVFANLVIALCILTMLKGQRIFAGFFLALATYQSLYPITLIFPLVISIFFREEMLNEEKNKNRKSAFISSTAKSILAFIIPQLALLYFSKVVITHDFDFIDRTYGFILNVRDLKPNIGLFWYFFTEMFEHFHPLFICTFQINAFIYVVPLSIRFFDQPPLLIYSLCSLMAIFKSYPSIGDVGLYLSLIPMWKHLFQFMQQKYLVACFFIATSVLAPIQWFLWIYSGSANANFYFGVTIAFGTAQIFLLTDVLLAYLKREFYLANGMKKEVNGIVAGLSLI